MEEEKVYLNYGDQQVDQAQLLTNMANQVQNYVNQQSWSGKRKQKFMDAYTDLVNKGLRGATNTSGRWQVEVGGDVDIESMDRKDREMYQEAAYFIQQQMQGIASAKQAEEEAKKAEMQKFDFLSGFAKHLNNTMAGGQQLQIGGENDQWNYLDERGTNGLRGINNRANRLADMLQTYSDSLDASKLDFTDTPYQNIDDFKAKVNTAIAALRSGDMNNIRPTLNAIGLNPNEFFYDGSGDQTVGADGNPITYAQQAQALAAEEAAKTQEAQQQAYLEAQANKGVLNWDNGIHSKEARISPKAYAEFLSNTYGVGETGFNNINARIQELIEGSYNKGLSAANKKELGNLLYYIRTNNPNYKGLGFGKATNLSDADWAELRTHTNHLSSVTKENFVRLPWKTSDGRITYADNQGNLYFLKPANHKQIAGPKFTRSAEYNNYKNNFLSGTSKWNEQARANYLKSSKDGLTSAEIEELASIGFDIASIVDPEMISSAGLALAGSGLRHHAAANQPGGMSTSDKWWQAADYGLSVLGSIPVLGDAALAARAVNNLKKAIVPLGVIMAGANVPQAAKAAYNKVVNGQDLTIQDWRAIGAVITAAVGYGRGRVMSKRAEALRKTGGTTSKQVKEGVIKTSEGDIKVSESKAKQLKEKFGKANGEERTKAIREDVEVQKAAKEQGIDLSKADVQGYSRFKSSPVSTRNTTVSNSGNRIATLRAMSKFNQEHGWLARKGLAEQDWVFRKTGGYESTPRTGFWQSIKNYFSKSDWDNFGNKSNTTSTKTTPTETNTSQTNNRQQQYDRAIINRYKNVLKGNTSNKPVTEGSYKLDDVTFTVKKGKDGKFTLINDQTVSKENPRFLFANLSEKTLKAKIAELVRHSRVQKDAENKITSKKSTQEIGKILQDLKKKGWLKQGGKITDNQIDNFLNQYK